MQTSNSKLSAEQKSWLKDQRKNSGVKIVSNSDGITLAYFKPLGSKGRMVNFAISNLSPFEKKLRAKVGEYHARAKLNCGEFATMNEHDFEHMCSWVYQIEVVEVY
jgi:hypothetical protein